MSERCRQLTYQERVQRFPLEFTVDAAAVPGPAILVPAAWRKRFIVPIPLHTRDGKLHTVYVHIHAAPVFAKFLTAVDGMPETYDGSWVPRLKRGVKLPAAGSGHDAYGPLLSNHSRGTAIDFNARSLPMGHPASGEPLLQINPLVVAALNLRVPMETNGHAWEAGVVWGGHWARASCDPMHFELGTFEPTKVSS